MFGIKTEDNEHNYTHDWHLNRHTIGIRRNMLAFLAALKRTKALHDRILLSGYYDDRCVTLLIQFW